VEYLVPDVIAVDELLIPLGDVLLDEGDDGLELQSCEVWVVLGLGIATSVDTRRDAAKVGWNGLLDGQRSFYCDVFCRLVDWRNVRDTSQLLIEGATATNLLGVPHRAYRVLFGHPHRRRMKRRRRKCPPAPCPLPRRLPNTTSKLSDASGKDDVSLDQQVCLGVA
jgi:hypothetical protein